MVFRCCVAGETWKGPTSVILPQALPLSLIPRRLREGQDTRCALEPGTAGKSHERSSVDVICGRCVRFPEENPWGTKRSLAPREVCNVCMELVTWRWRPFSCLSCRCGRSAPEALPTLLLWERTCYWWAAQLWVRRTLAQHGRTEVCFW